MYDRNFALAGFDRTHVFQMGFVYAAAVAAGLAAASPARMLQGWQINGIFAAYSGTPFSIGGTNTALNCPGCGSGLHRINVNGDPEPTRHASGSATEPYYPVDSSRSRPASSVAGFGNSGRNAFRRPPVWNVDLSLFKSFPIGRFRPEFRIEAANVFNHTNWGAPVTASRRTTSCGSRRRREQRDQHAGRPPRAGRASSAVLTFASGRLCLPDRQSSVSSAIVERHWRSFVPSPVAPLKREAVHFGTVIGRSSPGLLSIFLAGARADVAVAWRMLGPSLPAPGCGVTAERSLAAHNRWRRPGRGAWDR